jgi:hypothetical protein
MYNGLLIRLKGENAATDEEMEEELKRPWLISIHCVSHRIELALKDSLLNSKLHKATSDIQDVLISLFYLFKKSPKLSRLFKATGNASNVQVFKLKKVHGTRFVAHLRLGLKRRLNFGDFLKR